VLTKKTWRVEVWWDDCTLLAPGWTPLARIAEVRRKAVKCRSVGFVVRDDKHGITLAQNVHANDVAGVVHIPRGQIRKIKRRR
jgi:hypothetical protein